MSLYLLLSLLLLGHYCVLVYSIKSLHLHLKNIVLSLIEKQKTYQDFITDISDLLHPIIILLYYINVLLLISMQ